MPTKSKSLPAIPAAPRSKIRAWGKIFVYLGIFYFFIIILSAEKPQFRFSIGRRESVSRSIKKWGGEKKIRRQNQL